MMGHFSAGVQQSVKVKEKWATEARNAIIPEEICHISSAFCDKVPLVEPPNVAFQNALLGTKAKIWLIRSLPDCFYTLIMDPWG